MDSVNNWINLHMIFWEYDARARLLTAGCCVFVYLKVVMHTSTAVPPKAAPANYGFLPAPGRKDCAMTHKEF